MGRVQAAGWNHQGWQGLPNEGAGGGQGIAQVRGIIAGDALPSKRGRLQAASRVFIGLTEDEWRATLPSGRQLVIVNRVSWAVTHMERAGLLKRVRRGIYRITDDGLSLLVRNPSHVNMGTLRGYPAYVTWKDAVPDEKATSAPDPDNSTTTPEEDLAQAADILTRALQTDLFQRIRNAEPAVLERVVIELLSAMRYGGGDTHMARVAGRSGDHGIDGVIREDALGLDEIYVQAKRYADGNTVGESALRNFAGAIDAAGTVKGVFVTTSDFTPAALEYVKKSPKRIVLINGHELAKLMVEHNIGVRTLETYDVKRIDDNYFDGDLSG